MRCFRCGGDAGICIEDFAKDAREPTFEEFREAAGKELVSVYAKQYHIPECSDSIA